MDWYSLLNKYGVDVPNTDQFNILCPFHEDTVPSCSINLDEGVWICFAGCGQGSLKYFIYLLSGKTWKDIDAEIKEKSWELDHSLFDEPLSNDFIDTTSKYEEPDELVDILDSHWIYKRGFTKEIIRKWGCKTNRYLDLLIPVENTDSEIQGWISRRTQAIPKYLYSKGFRKSRALFGINNLVPDTIIILVEGALDCMWLDQHGYLSAAILGASVSSAQIDLLSKYHPSEVVLGLDNDEAGEKGIKKATVDMSNKFMLSYVDLPKNTKDFQDVRDQKIIEKIISNRRFW